MKYNAPYGVSDPNAAYANGNPATGTMGSIPPAASIEYPQREIANLITNSGITPSNSDLNQLARSLQSGKVVYGIDTGNATSYVLTLNPPLLAYYDGLAVWMIPANSNSGAASININGLGTKNIVRRGGASLSSGDMPANYKSLLTFNVINNNFELYGTGFTVGGFLPILQANTTLYVNGATGDDSIYDGTSATISGAHGPFKTIGRAMTETFKYGPSVYTMTINIAAGTYPENVATPAVVGPAVILNGAGKTSTIISGLSTPGYTINPTNGNTMTVQNCGVTTTNTASGTSTCVVTTSATLKVANCAFGGSPNGYLLDALGGTLIVSGNIDFNSGIAPVAAFASFTGGSIVLGDFTIAHLGPISVSSAYVVASGMAVVSTNPSPGGPTFTSPGNVTGVRYAAALNGVINTQGHAGTYFPGTSPGTLTSGGQYG